MIWWFLVQNSRGRTVLTNNFSLIRVIRASWRWTIAIVGAKQAHLGVQADFGHGNPKIRRQSFTSALLSGFWVLYLSEWRDDRYCSTKEPKLMEIFIIHPLTAQETNHAVYEYMVPSSPVYDVVLTRGWRTTQACKAMRWTSILLLKKSECHGTYFPSCIRCRCSKICFGHSTAPTVSTNKIQLLPYYYYNPGLMASTTCAK